VRPARIDLHIEELVLHDVPAAERRGFSERLSRELAGLLAGGDPRGRVGQPSDLVEQAAHTIYRSVARAAPLGVPRA
jgi:hypothetical protein